MFLDALYFSLAGGRGVNFVNSKFKRNMPKLCDVCTPVLYF